MKDKIDRQVWQNVWDQIEDKFLGGDDLDKVWEQVWDMVHEQVGVGDKFGDQFCGQVWMGVYFEREN